MQLYKEIITITTCTLHTQKTCLWGKKMFMIPVHGVSSDSVIPNWI